MARPQLQFRVAAFLRVMSSRHEFCRQEDIVQVPMIINTKRSSPTTQIYVKAHPCLQDSRDVLDNKPLHAARAPSAHLHIPTATPSQGMLPLHMDPGYTRAKFCPSLRSPETLPLAYRAALT